MLYGLQVRGVVLGLLEAEGFHGSPCGTDDTHEGGPLGADVLFHVCEFLLIESENFSPAFLIHLKELIPAQFMLMHHLYDQTVDAFHMPSR